MLLRGIPETADEAHEIVKATAETTPNTQVPRSEERRVGKEGRSRWSPDH